MFNFVGPAALSRYDFAVAVARRLGLDEKLVRPIKTEEEMQSAMLLGRSRAKRVLRLGLQVTKLLEAVPDISLMGLDASLCDWLGHQRGSLLSSVEN